MYALRVKQTVARYLPLDVVTVINSTTAESEEEIKSLCESFYYDLISNHLRRYARTVSAIAENLKARPGYEGLIYDYLEYKGALSMLIDEPIRIIDEKDEEIPF